MINNYKLRNMRKNGVFNNNEGFGYDKPIKEPGIDIITIVIGIVVMALMVVLVQGCAYSQVIQGIDVDRLANSIYISEGGSATRHPYGILQYYKHTTPRQACINTINHKLRDWNKEIVTRLDEREFIAYLGQTYCPVGAKNDPTGLNVNWINNTIELYEKL